MLEFIATTIAVGKWIDTQLGKECPKCYRSSYWLEEDKGTTWITGRRKIKCGHCDYIFKLDK